MTATATPRPRRRTARAAAVGPRPARHLHPPGREALQRRRRRQLRRPTRADRRPGRRVRLRQVGDLAGDHGPAARARQPGRGRRRPSRAPTCCRSRREGHARPARPRHRDDLPGPAVVAEPGRPDRAARSPRCWSGTAGCRARRRQPEARELLERVGIPDPNAPAQGLPPPAQRRHAPARAHRDGAGLRPAAADRRRADHGARRHDPGADPGPAQGAGRRRPAPRWS